MKKNLLVLPLFALSIGALVGCGGGQEPQGGDPQDPQDLGSSFNADYYPKKSENIVKSLCDGKKKKITVALNFEGTEAAWKVLGEEYSRLSGNWVEVDIKTFASTDLYVQNLQQQETNQRTEWDIVSGNLLSNCTASTVNLNGIETKKNPYMGNKKWKEALTSTAYDGDSTYMLNSEDLLTCWFVNTAATTEAKIDASKATPTTWEGLISNLEALKQAGYNYPLGLSLTADSIQGSQFAWLLRIYGDYYFRNNYAVISKSYDSVTRVDDLFTYDPTNQEIESDSTCDRSYSRMLCTMMDDTSPYFCGPTSTIYTEFINQFYKLKKYIHPSAATFTFSNIREQFKAQSLGTDGKDSPQIILDYSGKGLQYMDSEKLKGHLEYFDYPQMKDATKVDNNTITRDVGGSGGYLSIFNARSSQLELNKDFLEFVLSPYGQSIYYKALSSFNLAPQGLTTVKSNLVVIPNTWKEFFQNPKITNTGKADKNKYLTFGVLGLDKIDYAKEDKDTKNATNMWKQLLTGTTYTVEQYNSDWLDVLLDAWETVSVTKGWSKDAYKQSNFSNPNAIKDTMK